MFSNALELKDEKKMEMQYQVVNILGLTVQIISKYSP